MSAWDFATVLAKHWKLLLFGPLLVGALTLAYSFSISPTFTAKTTFLPPQQPQSAAAAALSSLGPLAGLAGGVGGIKNPVEQYIALMQSRTISDRLIDHFDLAKVYETPVKSMTRKVLAANVRIGAGKKDGLIGIEVDDRVPERAAAIANQYVLELRKLTTELALTEAQQRRMFFEKQLALTKANLTSAQQTLQASGLSAGMLKAEPRAAADSYAKLRAETTAAEVRLQTLRASRNEAAAEVQQALATLTALRGQLQRLEASTSGGDQDSAGYISRYREFKYQESLFELFSRQFEMAKVDESREGSLIQVLDPAEPPDRKTKPVRSLMALSATLVSTLVLLIFLILRDLFQKGQTASESQARWASFKAALKGH